MRPYKYVKDTKLMKPFPSTKEFRWIGSPWTCSKMWRHFPSFLRHGIKISVNSFVYVLAEENQRLVAYLEDLYEDSRCNKMAMVRWFHKIDEVGNVLPQNFSDREIFFSLCLQDLNIECIDGMATVLSPHHFEKYMKTVVDCPLELFVCDNLFEDDEIKSFDITKMKGYWNQEVVRQIFSFPPPKPPAKSQPFDALKEGEQDFDDNWTRPKKKQRGLESCAAEEHCNLDKLSSCNSLKKEAKPNPQHCLSVGSEVEVLCQDSGIRGCWFRALIIKMTKDKVKVCYQDLYDAVDESKKLEEWISSSKVAAPDGYGLWAPGRKTIRPSLPSAQSKFLCPIDIGTVVNVWRHDGWWEGIVVQESSEGRFCVFFPGEKQESVAPIADLRRAYDWSGDRWVHVLDRPDVVTKIVSKQRKSELAKTDGTGSDSELQRREVAVCRNPREETKQTIINKLQEVAAGITDTKDSNLVQLKWKSSRKRSCRRSALKKLNYEPHRQSSHTMDGCTGERRFKIRMPFMVDKENCKLMGDSHFNCSVVPPPTNLVMSR